MSTNSARKPPGPKKKKAGRSGRKPEKKTSLIGTRKESSLHRSLKFQYSGDEGKIETYVGDYICDALTGEGEIIEVQTGSFAPLKEKVKKFSLTHKVRIIHPVFMEKVIEVYGAEGGLLYRRKSPKKGNPWDLFTALVYAPELSRLKNVTIELALIDVVEKRVDDGKGSWRRRGIRIADRVVSGWRGSVILKKPADYYRFIPFKKNEPFTVRSLGETAKINERAARKTLYTLTKMGLTKRVGKLGNAIVYERAR